MDDGTGWRLLPLVREEYPWAPSLNRDTWLRVREALTPDEMAESLDLVRMLMAAGDADGR